ncbi:CvfB family protein [Anaerosinus gibii]|uniref:S1-like domain-containing RNA-binding protein n=1 Tax=Selenobaculum gibii TaxID=3054208 RepID=A0A9Y2AJV4_9FIRM|nr:S1-like domain-containing RNA-binding protein [Selenobaculum gbiensis]WIW71426.1 S1-like domain-containing RNA-binding protein [Selenobaculum gbiensis]
MSDKENNRLKPSTVATLEVVRKSEMGAFLDAGTGNTSDDILLHKTQQIRSVEIGEKVDVFLYLDPKGRLTASMRVPQMRVGQIARVNIINTSKDGAFVDVGAERGIFMPYAGMRGKVQVGEKVWAKLYIDKSGRLAVTMEVEDELRRASKPAEGIKVGDKVKGTVYNYTDQGAFIFTEARNIAFMYNGEMISRPRVGEEVEVRVTFLREDGRLNVSMRPVKENAIVVDAEKILNLLKTRGGKMPYSDETSAEVIKDKFNISKSAFKRAMGSLLKNELIEQKDGWTFLKNNE